MQETDFYETIKEQIHKTTEPFTVIFTKLSLSKNEGGELQRLENQLPGPLRKNQNVRYMIGLKSVDDPEDVKHIYMHCILEIINSKGEHFKLQLR